MKCVVLPVIWLMAATMLLLSDPAQAGNRVLFLAPAASKSHTNFFLGVAKALVDNGDEVTMVMPFSRGKKFVREVVLPVDINDLIPKNIITSGRTAPMQLFTKSPTYCANALATEEAQAVLKENYDVVMLTVFVSDCFLPAIYQMGVPYIMVSPAGLMGPWFSVAGNPQFTSFIPDVMFSSSENIDISHGLPFFNRMVGTLSSLATYALMNFYLISSMESALRSKDLYPANTPSLHELRHNSSLFLLNSIRSMESVAQPYVPTVIHAGGIHLHDSNPLSADLEEWVQGAGEDGFIFFSMGSAITPSDMPEEFRKMLVKVFGSLKQRVLWKWDLETMEDLPSNVRIGKWLPQQDILGHTKLRVFITHGGLHSTMEAIHHGTPVIGLPVMGDQYLNLKESVSQGWGRIIDWNIDEDTLKQVLDDVINSKTMRGEAQRISTFLQDQIKPPSEVATYWVSYVVRHNGAKHLRCPAIKMPWWKLYNVDVWTTVIAVQLLCIYLFCKMMATCFRCCCRRTKKKVE
ncbi:unnamed protein product [Meganyctiphanes norvegica]|uniref:UDP-glucuronosyltransferase n=1 Tax=Meganyctiphanes norvegica TaxID=48144 RepID=A0AAV2PJD7_MEGNR